MFATDSSFVVSNVRAAAFQRASSTTLHGADTFLGLVARRAAEEEVQSPV